MSHLKENNIGYLSHLVRAWRWALILLVHGIFPNVWQTKVSDEICKKKNYEDDHHSKYLMNGL